VEWPFFAVYAVYLWWRLIHEDPADPAPATTARDQEEREEELALAEYNRYLAALEASGRRKHW
jgi:hypothetical protein